jgi:hypothetical protein
VGKRSSYARRERDLYLTPAKAVAPLLPHLAPGARFVEPCAANGQLLDLLEAAGLRCAGASDIEPLRGDVARRDVLSLGRGDLQGADGWITNPPWTRAILHALIWALLAAGPAWLLFDADWFHTKQAKPFKPHLRRFVSIGRVRWIEGSKSDGVDNCAWYYFDPTPGPTLMFVAGERPETVTFGRPAYRLQVAA